MLKNITLYDNYITRCR